MPNYFRNNIWHLRQTAKALRNDAESAESAESARSAAWLKVRDIVLEELRKTEEAN